MRLALTFVLVLVGMALPAESAPNAKLTLASVTSELDSLISDLEANQGRTLELQTRLTELEALSATHVNALAEQGQQLAAYEQTVHALEVHDRRTLELLSNERLLNSWLLPVAGVATALALVETIVLVWVTR